MVISSVKSGFQHPCWKFNEDVSRQAHQPFRLALLIVSSGRNFMGIFRQDL